MNALGAPPPDALPSSGLSPGALPQRVRIVEVGARDGLQNEPQVLGTAVKLEFIARLATAGLADIEATAFVSPRRVPQMADHTVVMQGLPRHSAVRYWALVPNLQGLEAALAAGARAIAVFTAASETFSWRNTHCSIAQSLQRIGVVAQAALAQGVAVRGYVSCVLGCPYEGAVAPSDVAQLARRLLELGCEEVSLGDTIGIGTPGSTLALLDTVTRVVPVAQLAGHFHDTYGQGLANVYAALQAGVSVFDSSVSGLGGCPYAPGASGNLATEDLLYMLEGLGIRTGVQLDALLGAGDYICRQLGRQTASRVARARHAAAGAAQA